MTPDTPPGDQALAGVAALADRPVDQRRLGRVMGLFGLLCALTCLGGAERLLDSANLEPEVGAVLRRLANEGPAPAGGYAHVAVVLIDGLRVDEARQLERAQRLRPQQTVIRLPAPTLSRPFYHHLLTGVPQDLSGVRSNRFSGRARFDSVTDRVRDEGGRVFIAADGLSWMRTMHGAAEDGGSDRPGTLGAPLDSILHAWSAAPAPSLLIVHHVAGDATAHQGGVHSEAHLRAVRRADAVVERVAAAGAGRVFVVSDHGHLTGGGHGGAEREVARSPLLRLPGTGPRLPPEISAGTLAASLSLALGVRRPRSAVRAASPALAGRAAPADGWWIRAASVAHAGTALALRRLADRRRWSGPLTLLLVFMALGPIKRGFGFDRSTLLLWLAPALVTASHRLMGLPFSLSAITSRDLHVGRILGIGALAAALSIGCLYALGRGPRHTRALRAASTTGWALGAAALLSAAAVGFSLGPWPLSARLFYAPLLACGSAASGMAVSAAALLCASRREAG